MAATNNQQRPRDSGSDKSPATPLCRVHARIKDRGALVMHYGNGCVACSLNERKELLDVLGSAVAQGEVIDSVSFLRGLIPTDEDVESYIRSLPWSDDAEEHEKTLVAGNIRGFVAYLQTRSGELRNQRRSVVDDRYGDEQEYHLTAATSTQLEGERD